MNWNCASSVAVVFFVSDIGMTLINVLSLDGNASIETSVAMKSVGALNLHKEIEAAVEHL